MNCLQRARGTDDRPMRKTLPTARDKCSGKHRREMDRNAGERSAHLQGGDDTQVRNEREGRGREGEVKEGKKERKKMEMGEERGWVG